MSDNAQYKTGALRLGGLTVDSSTYLATQNGNVGIGTTGPSQKFQVNDTATAAFVVTSAGQVGIGTTGPGYKLDVVGDINLPTAGFLRIAGSAGSSGQVLTRTTTGMAWQAVTGAGVTQLNQGTGITLSPNPITTTGTISANTTYLQRRVTGTCASDQAIRVINADGTVTCVQTASIVCTWSGTTYTTGAKCNPTSSCYVNGSDNQKCICQSNGSWACSFSEPYPCPIRCGT